jgi:hypothetical protein
MPGSVPTVSTAGCRVIEFPVAADERGNLTVIEGKHHVPFEIARVFYLDVVPSGATRAGHANRHGDHVLIAVAGSFDVILDDGRNRETLTLSGSSYGLLVPRLIWRELEQFSSGAVCLVIASLPYDEGDYYREHQEYVRAVTTT